LARDPGLTKTTMGTQDRLYTQGSLGVRFDAESCSTRGSDVYS
jgi:hypothetical protein